MKLKNAWTPLAFAEHWPCRKCRVLVGVTKETIDARATLNAELRRKREPELDKARIVLCDECKRRDDELAQMEHSRSRDRRPEQQALRLEDPTRASGMQNKKPTTKRRRKA